MKIKVVSDLHLEFSDVNVKNEHDYDLLILSGDIMVSQDLHDHPEPLVPYPPEIVRTLGSRQAAAQRFRDFLKRVSFQFPHVIYVAGNHEFYHGKWVAGLEYLRAECARFPNVYFLENDTKEIDDVLFVGATLWTDMNKHDPLTIHTIEGIMNDFRIIRHDAQSYRRIKPNDCILRHNKTLKYFTSVLDANSEKTCVVVSHMAPTFASIGSRYVKETTMNGGYASDLSNFILDRPQIKLWTHGHVHDPSDYMVGTTRVVCNPRGYEGYDETFWDPEIIIEI